jgi:NAD(P)-dependent dehydrogenase (short-subunit alcohol dehydrogenase family)
MDMNDIARHAMLIDECQRRLGGIDAVLIAHGTLPDQAACQVSFEATRAELETNFMSVVSLLTHAANYCERQGKGAIAVISSVAGDRGRQSNYVYGRPRERCRYFCRVSATGFIDAVSGVITIKPGFVDTPMTADFPKNRTLGRPRVGRPGRVSCIGRRPRSRLPSMVLAADHAVDSRDSGARLQAPESVNDMSGRPDPIPLCVDLDGTLIRTDVLLESFLGLVKSSPLRAIRALFGLRRGRAEFKQDIADQVDLDASLLPYDDESSRIYARSERVVGASSWRLPRTRSMRDRSPSTWGCSTRSWRAIRKPICRRSGSSTACGNGSGAGTSTTRVIRMPISGSGRKLEAHCWCGRNPESSPGQPDARG